MLSLIIPVKQEDISKFITNILPLLEKDGELLVIFDNRADIDCKAVQCTSLRLIKNKKQGLAAAIATGIEFAQYQLVCWMDVDFMQPYQLIMRMYKEIPFYDFVVASRYVTFGRDCRETRIRVLLSKIYNKLAQLLLKLHVSDLTSGFIMARKELVEKIGIRGYSGEYCVYLLFFAEKMGYRIKELPYILNQRQNGKSKIASDFFIFVRNGLYYLWALVNLYFFNLFYSKCNIVADRIRDRSREVISDNILSDNNLHYLSLFP